MSGEIGVCSWSFPNERPEELARACREAGVRVLELDLQVFLSESWPAEDAMGVLRDSGLQAVSGMITTVGEDFRVDAAWPSNLERAESAAVLAERLGLELVTLHAGFLPTSPADPLRATMVGRIREIADRFAARGIALGLETGTDTAETLLSVLEEASHPGVCVNFDPANMIMWDTGDPVAALDALAVNVRQIHVKDALPSSEPGTLGKEVAVGSGNVDWPSLLAVVDDRRISCNLMIERDGGASAVEDVAQDRAFIERLLGSDG